MADITMSIGLDAQDAIDKAHDLQLEIKDIFDKTSGKNLGKQFDNIKKQMSSASSAAWNLERQMAKLENKKVGYTPIFQQTINDVEKLEKEIETYKQQLRTLTNPNDITRTTIALQATEHRLKQTQAYQAQLEAQDKKWVYGRDSDEYQRLAERLGDANNRMAMLVSSARELTDEGNKAGSTWSSFKASLEHTKATANKILTVFRRIVTPITKAVSALGKLGARMSGLNKASEKHNTSLKKMINQVLRYGLGIRSIFILWRKLRAYTADALKLMATQFREVDEDVSALMNSFNQMKLSFGTMAQPLMHALRPALIYIIELITRATTALANFFAILTGQKFIYKAQKANDSYADSIGGVGSAAKEANKELAEYDNLLVIKSPNDGSGGGGGGAADGLTGTFEKTLAESDFAKQLRDAIERGDWEGVGSAFAEKLNIITEKFDNWINKKFRPKGVEWSKRIGRILNGWVDTWDGELFGKTVGDSLMSVMDIVATWWETVKWKNLGKKVADAVNGLFTSWEPKTVARFFTGKINAVIDFAAGMFDSETGVNFAQMGTKLGESIKNFIEDIHWDTLGADLSNLANGILTGLSSAIESSNLGVTVGNAINRFLSNIDFKALAENLSDLAMNILDALADVIETTDWKDVGEAIADFLTHIDWISLIAKLTEVALALIKGLAEALLGLASNPEALADIGTALLAIFGVKFIWNKITGLFKTNVATSIGSGVSGATATGGSLMTKCKGLLTAFFSTTFGQVAGILMATVGAQSLIGSVGSVIAYALGDEELSAEYSKLARNPVKYMVSAIGEGINAAKEYCETSGKSILSTAWSDMWADIFGQSTTLDDANKSTSYIYDKTQEQFQRAQYSWDVMGYWVSDEEWEKFKNSCDDYVAKINELQEVAAKGAKGMSDYAEKYKQMAQDVTGGNEEIIDSTQTMNNQMSDYSSKYKESIYGMTDYSEKYKKEAPADINEGNKEIKESFYTMSSYIPPTVKEAMEKTADGMVTSFDEVPTELGTRGTKAVESIEKPFETLPSDLTNTAKSSVDGIKNTFTQDALTSHFAAIKENIETPFKELPTFFSDTFKESWESAESAFSSGETTFNSFNSSISQGMTSTINGLIDGLNSVVARPFQKIQEIINKFRNIKFGVTSPFSSLPSFSGIPSIPHLAQGAVIPPNREFLAMLGDQTSGTNIETPLATMVQAFKQALSEMGSSNNQNIVLQLDGRTVAQCVWDEEDKRYKQTGRR